MPESAVAPNRIRRSPAPLWSLGSVLRALQNATTAPAQSPSCSRTSPSANHAAANPGARSAACANRSAAATRSPRACKPRAKSKRRSARMSPEDMNTGVGMMGTACGTENSQRQPVTRTTPTPAYIEEMRPQDILMPVPAGLCCKPGGFHIDPVRAVERAVITHGHSDHARPGHGAVLATQETLDMMRLRYGDNFAGSTQAVAYGETVRLGDVSLTFRPAGHVLGSAQIAVSCAGTCI